MLVGRCLTASVVSFCILAIAERSRTTTTKTTTSSTTNIRIGNLLLSSFAVEAQQQQYHQQRPHRYTDAFATWDEYDYSILDPRSAYGSPYGGFSRATASRLAKLPLHLPAVPGDERIRRRGGGAGEDEDENDEDPLYMKVRDFRGRLFACRVFDEDELEPDSLYESMFDAPRLRALPPDSSDEETEKAVAVAAGEKKEVTDATGEKGSYKDVNVAEKSEKKDTNEEDDEEEDDDEEEEDDEDQEAIILLGTNVKYQINTKGDVGNIQRRLEKQQFLDESNDDPMARNLLRLINADTKLQALQGLCGHIHLGWWSYEWCFESHVSQFHIDFDSGTEELQITDITSLGRYANRQIKSDLTNEKPNLLAEGMGEMARIEDNHVGGDVCDATGKPRTTKVNLICCSDNVLASRRGKVQKRDQQQTQKPPHKSKTVEDDEDEDDDDDDKVSSSASHSAAAEPNALASIHSVEENEDEICTYTVIICTSMLCETPADKKDQPQMKKHVKAKKRSTKEEGSGGATAAGDGTPDGATSSSSSKKKKSKKKKKKKKRKENESVRDILERTLGDVCLQSNTGGWWTYEICHGKNIRQFHEVIGSHKSQSGATYTSRVVDLEHFLGWFIEEDEVYPNEEEWKHVVNVTDNSKGEGNGAYFEVEYTGGDICDNSDVTDAAVIAGTTGGSGGIARASSVRYYCGSAYDVAVSEDSTCHYIVEVHVPDLCAHALFNAPVSKAQVVKCLPVEEEDDELGFL